MIYSIDPTENERVWRSVEALHPDRLLLNLPSSQDMSKKSISDDRENSTSIAC